MFRAAIGKVNPTVLAVTVASTVVFVSGAYADTHVANLHRHGKDMTTIQVLQSRVEHYVAREQILEASRVADRTIQRELQSERDHIAEQAFYAYRELCRLLIDQEAARVFTASDTLEQKKADIMMLLGSENIYADDYNAWADANAGVIEAAQKRDKARTLIRMLDKPDHMLDKPDHYIYAVSSFHIRWLYPDRSTLREAGSTTDSIVLREARADLIAAGLLKRGKE